MQEYILSVKSRQYLNDTLSAMNELMFGQQPYNKEVQFTLQVYYKSCFICNITKPVFSVCFFGYCRRGRTGQGHRHRCLTQSWRPVVRPISKQCLNTIENSARWTLKGPSTMKPAETCAKPFWQSVWSCLRLLLIHYFQPLTRPPYIDNWIKLMSRRHCRVSCYMSDIALICSKIYKGPHGLLRGVYQQVYQRSRHQ